MTTRRSRLTKSDLMIFAVLFYSFFSYPFFLRAINEFGYALLLYALCGLLLIVAITTNPRTSIGARTLGSQRWIILWLTFYAVYFLALTVATTSQLGEIDVVKGFFLRLRDILLVTFFVIFLSEIALRRFLIAYSNLLVFCAICGILLVILKKLNLAPLLFSVQLNGGYGGTRDFYGLGFVWPNSWIGSLSGFERLQSFADEAGTFAFAACPAIFVTYIRRSWVRFSILAVAVVLTFSVGAIFALGVIGTLMFLKRKPVVAAMVVILLVGLSSTVNLGESTDSGASAYLSSKVDTSGGHSSVGQRVQNISDVLTSVGKYPLGVGPGGVSSILNLSVAVGWLIPLLEAGYVGWLAYVFSFVVMLWVCFRVLYGKGRAIRFCSETKVVALVLLVNAFAAFQRAGIDATLWNWCWIILFIRLFISDRRQSRASVGQAVREAM